MNTFIDPNLLRRLRVGSLAAHLDAYLKHIQQEGFLPTSAPMQMYAIARFSKWISDRSLDVRQLDEAVIKRFLERDPGVVHSCESATLYRLLAMLRQIGATVVMVPEPSNCHQRFIEAYRCYLLQERGLAVATVAYFVRFAEEFLSDHFGNGDLRLSKLCAQDVTGFVQSRAHRLSPGRAKLLVTALRSLLRYMRHQGEISIDLARCVPPVAMWSLSTLPKSLPAGAVQRLLDHQERETPGGRGTTPFSCCSPDWVCGPARSLHCNWMISIGITAGSPSVVRADAWRRCLCHPMSARLSQSIYALAAHAVTVAESSFDIELPFVVLHTPSPSPPS